LLARGIPSPVRDAFAREVYDHVEILNRLGRHSALSIERVPAAFARASRISPDEAHDVVPARRQKCAELAADEPRCARYTDAQTRRAKSFVELRVPTQIFAGSRMAERELPIEFAMEDSLSKTPEDAKRWVVDDFVFKTRALTLRDETMAMTPRAKWPSELLVDKLLARNDVAVYSDEFEFDGPLANLDLRPRAIDKRRGFTLHADVLPRRNQAMNRT
jgi:hypothetical protein